MSKSIRKTILAIVLAVCVLGIAKHTMTYSNYQSAQINTSSSTDISKMEDIPDYTGTDTIEINGGNAFFANEWNQVSEGEICLSELDSLGRCGTAMIKATSDTLPTKERGSTGKAKPTGWIQNKYPGIIESDPPYLYNRAHLLMWAISGLNDDTRNLITGTRHFNLTMLDTENEVLDHIKNGEVVLYRVTPIFERDDLLAKGVLMEATNEDGSWQICRFVYNVQPGIYLYYATGDNYVE